MILQDMTQSDMIARIAELEAKLERAKHRKATLKVSAAGAVSLYGLGKWPVTLYASQWERVLAMASEIKEFIEDNSDKLTRKD